VFGVDAWEALLYVECDEELGSLVASGVAKDCATTDSAKNVLWHQDRR
jgi:hypothetical protein